MKTKSPLRYATVGALLAVVGVSVLHTANASTLRISNPPCAASYNVIGAVYDGDESESINGQTFTDESPFICDIDDVEQTVDLNFSATSTDPITGCTYDLRRINKETQALVGSTETLSCAEPKLHYGVLAVPRANDPDCRDLPVIDVDPQVQVGGLAGSPPQARVTGSDPSRTVEAFDRGGCPASDHATIGAVTGVENSELPSPATMTMIKATIAKTDSEPLPPPVTGVYSSPVASTATTTARATEAEFLA